MSQHEISMPGADYISKSYATKWIVIVWIILLSGALFWVGRSYVERMSENKTVSDMRHTDRMAINRVEQGQTEVDLSMPAGAHPIKVLTGIYVDRIIGLDIKNSSWTVECLVWFSWTGEKVKPGENFRFVGGTMDSKDLEDSYSNGTQHYERYRIIATLSKIFDVTRYPCDDHQLVINYENTSYKRYEMVFIPDSAASEISSRVQVPGYAINQVKIIEKPHTYKTSRGDPRLQAHNKATYSQFKIGIWMNRTDSSFYLKLSITLFGAVALALMMFFIDPAQIDARLALGLTGVFAAIGNTYITSSLLPDMGSFAMIDIMNAFSFLIISIAVLEASIACYLTEKSTDSSFIRMLDYSTFVVLSVSYTVTTVTLYLAAN
jgi:hypothetical protein